ncbi:MAG: polyribonucleotide nucleotidyltransferase [Anaerolineaceae bacterium]|nr:polyribonucleotide nucleotidyltransferase [Anaerolineaceae bacterium]
MKPQAKTTTAQVGPHSISFETGKLAMQAGGAVTVRLGDAVIFATATMSDKQREGLDFLPLSVDYEERMYAGGRIPGSFFRREGRPSTDATLTARLTDRPIRPLFNSNIRNSVQIIIYALSADLENPLDILAINAASAAIMVSDIPWDGPIGAVRIGRLNGEFVVNPTFEIMENSDLDLRIAGTKEAVLMVECAANEVADEIMVEALSFGHQSLQPIIDAQIELAEMVAKPKRDVLVYELDNELIENVYQFIHKDIEAVLDLPYLKANFYDGMDTCAAKVVEEFSKEEEPETISDAKAAFQKAEKKVIRQRILNQGKRPDGRNTTDVRNIWCEVGYSPRAHGTGLFTRGETQALTMATLGTPKEAQELDNLSPINSKRYIHHYNFPPFCTGEAKPLRGSSRREVGHGALAERALVPVIPAETEFPYTIRLVSEILSSNGSSSMASVCGSTLALMDAGVPIKAPVSGIAMGLIKEGEDTAILSDIMGMEDHLGDMDFKVTGTDKGITALQMDIKIKGITPELMSAALEQAKVGRKHILDKMLEVMPAPNANLKEHTPRIEIINIPVAKIGAIIGPGGKTIRSIQEETGTKIDIDDEGHVFVASANKQAAEMARERVLSLTESAEIGRIYTGKVVRTTNFGAFVEILPNIDGLVHISQLDSMRVNSVEDVVTVGDEITVMVIGIDNEGKIRLSRQAVLEGWSLEEAIASDSGGRSKSSSRGRDGGNRRNDRDRNKKPGDRDSRDTRNRN